MLTYIAKNIKDFLHNLSSEVLHPAFFNILSVVEIVLSSRQP